MQESGELFIWTLECYFSVLSLVVSHFTYIILFITHDKPSSDDKKTDPDTGSGNSNTQWTMATPQLDDLAQLQMRFASIILNATGLYIKHSEIKKHNSACGAAILPFGVTPQVAYWLCMLFHYNWIMLFAWHGPQWHTAWTVHFIWDARICVWKKIQCGTVDLYLLQCH